MILRRVYLYLVSAASLVLLAAGLALLGGTILQLVFTDVTADSVRGALAIYTAMAVVALPVWAVHFWLARRFAMRDPYERAAALRRLYLYFACLVMSIAAMVAITSTATQLLGPVFDARTFDPLPASQSGWAAIVFSGIWAFHFYIASTDRAAAGEQGASSTLRRWYMYVALIVGLFAMLTGVATVLQVGLTRLALGASAQGVSLAGPAGLAIGGTLLWGVHGRTIALHHITEDRHTTLRALEGFLSVAVCIAVALVGASQILYYLLARLVGISNPGGVGDNLLAGLAAPLSQLLVFGVAWFLLQRRLVRDAGTQEADRQAGIRRLYTNLAALVSLAAWSVGAGGLLVTLAEQIEAPILGVPATDWKNPVTLYVTLLVVGLAVWVAHWRHSPWATDRQSLSRRLYVWAALLGSVLAAIGSGVGMINAVLQQVFAANPKLDDPANLAFGRYLAIIMVAAGVGVYHWRVQRGDAATRPKKPVVKPAVVSAALVPATESHEDSAPVAEALGPRSRRYTLVVTDATDDDVHQALSGLPPAAGYHLTPTEQTVDGR